MKDDYQKQMIQLIDKSEIVNVLNDYFHALDEKNFDSKHFGTIFTADARVIRPNDMVTVGPEEISATHAKSLSHYESTQHLLTGHDISINNNYATVRVNLVAMHMYKGSNQDANKSGNFFIAGGVVTAELTHTNNQWKILQTRNDVMWRAGNGAKLQAIFQKMA